MGWNRHVFGDTDEVKVTVRETVTVTPGDLMFICNNTGQVTNSLGGASAAADYFAYPWAAGREASTLISGNSPAKGFIGVAMDDSPNSSTDIISVATKGVFRFPLVNLSVVTIGAVVSGVSPSGFSATASTTASYTVSTGFSSGSIGYVVLTQTAASATTQNFIDFRIRTLLGDGLIS